MKPLVKMTIIGFLVGVLALIRLYEYRFFYDPFMYFFERAFQEQQEFHFPPRMFFNVFLRFLLNTLVSLSILYVAFKNIGIIKFASVIYACFFVALFPLFIYLMHHVTPDDYLAAFYVRRFLAHPVLILILLPAFYYYRLKSN
ncbi:MAG TPA: exosortase F system-associated protein [Salinimicrobium catena]|uniref:Exosortase F system-associated protein n=1 Tax=Salinimicrobium catena TaxID=390640 RepID=A0A7C2M866_9FLAO|nr:exosortase F system-associated protein [Salinimicrobium catena]